MAAQERAWAEALAQEQAHQRELLATFRGELGAFARELATTLTALDACVGGFGEVAQALDSAKTAHRNAGVVADVARRCKKLQPSGEDAELHESLAAGDIPPRLVDHARSTLEKEPTRTDHELLKAVATAAGARARIEELIGPAPVAALTGLAPLARRIPRLTTAGERELEQDRKHLTEVLNAAGTTGSAADLPEIAAAASLAGSLRDAATHADAAAREVERGRIKEVIAAARKQLEADLSRLQEILDGADDEPADWREARATELAALREEVKEKLERIERVRGWLLMLLPRVQLVARALGTAERVHAAQAHLSGDGAVTAEAARQSLTADLGTAWDPLLGAVAQPAGAEGPQRRLPRRWLAAAAAVIALAAAGTAIGLTMGGDDTSSAEPTPSASVPTTAPVAPTDTSKPTPAAPEITPIRAVFAEALKTTFYDVRAFGPEKVTYKWSLKPPADDPNCNQFEVVKPSRAAWHHGGDRGCSHVGIQHNGTVTVVITTPAWFCTVVFAGSLTRTGAPPAPCGAR